MLEWFFRGHSFAWMIHSGPFSCLNDSAGAFVLLEWFIQDHSVAWIFRRGNSYYFNDVIQDHSDAWMILPGHSLCLNDSFRTIQLLEWFCRGIHYAWMIHSGPFRWLNDLFSCILQNVFTPMVSVRWCGEISIIFITYEKHVWNWTYLMVWYECFSWCTEMSKANLQIDFVHKDAETKFGISSFIVACYISSHTRCLGTWDEFPLFLRTNLITNDCRRRSNANSQRAIPAQFMQ